MDGVKFFKIFIILFILTTPATGASRKTPRQKSKKSISRQLLSVPTLNQNQKLQRIFSAELKRTPRSADILPYLSDTDPVVIRAACLALGRIGDDSALDRMARLFRSKNREIKVAAAFSLGLLSNSNAARIVSQNITMQKDPLVVAELYKALGRNGSKEHLPTFFRAMDEKTPEVAGAALQGLGQLLSGKSEDCEIPVPVILRLFQLSEEKEPLGPSAAFALSRYKGPLKEIPLSGILGSLQKAQSVQAQIFLLRTIGKIKDPTTVDGILPWLHSEKPMSLRIEAVKALNSQRITEAHAGILSDLLQSPSNALVFQTLDTLRTLSPLSKNTLEKIIQMVGIHPSIWMQQTALKTLAHTDPRIARQIAVDLLNKVESPLYPAATYAFVLTSQDEDSETIFGLLKSNNMAALSEVLIAMKAWPAERFSTGIRNHLRQCVERLDVASAVLISELVEKHKWIDYQKTLVIIYEFFKAPDQVEARLAILPALGQIGDRTLLDFLRRAYKDPEKLVVLAAVEAVKTITGIDESSTLPPFENPHFSLPSLSEAVAASRKTVVLHTNRGEIRVALFPDTPATSLNFVKLSTKGKLGTPFYEGQTFHRVVPNFVVQGGDPRGDGYGGPGYLIRDELTMRMHARGIVGMATAGKDTAGSQFFINLSHNPHLDGRYTAFGKVVSGIEVADLLEPGERIEQVTIEK